MRIIFVGIYNKPNLQPLCSSTKTGKLVKRIINELPKGIEIKKTNLFDIDYLPEPAKRFELSNEWYYANLPTDEDIIILLGALTHKEFRHNVNNIIKVAHPASKRSHEAMNKYVENTVIKIKEKISLISKIN